MSCFNFRYKMNINNVLKYKNNTELREAVVATVV